MTWNMRWILGFAAVVLGFIFFLSVDSEPSLPEERELVEVIVMELEFPPAPAGEPLMLPEESREIAERFLEHCYKIGGTPSCAKALEDWISFGQTKPFSEEMRKGWWLAGIATTTTLLDTLARHRVICGGGRCNCDHPPLKEGELVSEASRLFKSFVEIGRHYYEDDDEISQAQTGWLNFCEEYFSEEECALPEST